MKTNRITCRIVWLSQLVGGLMLLLAFRPAVAVVDAAGFDRYEIILRRRPFGAAPPEEDAGSAVSPSPPPPAFVERLRMVAITDRGGHVRVGFVDGSEKPPRNYFLYVGDSENGFQLVSANYERESAIVSKDGHEMELRMGGATSMVATTSPRAGIGQPTVSSGRRPQATIARSTITREQYEEERAAGIRGAPRPPQLALRQNRDAPSMADLPPQVRDMAMRKYNMELIRAGGEKGLPLPIPLSPEEDAQLVAEGVLPPQ